MSVPIHVGLISKDPVLAKTCREILGEILFDSDLLFNLEATSASVPEYDLCIWDFTPPEAELVTGLNGSLQKCLFVVQRQHVPVLQEHAGTADLHIVLKPVTRATLSAFLNETCRSSQNLEVVPSRLGTLRAERDEMLQCLMQANLKLQEYDQARTNFLARCLHDFRAPLTTFVGYCSLLSDGQLGPVTVEQRETLETMRHSARRLTRITNAMFQLSVDQKVEQGLRLEPGDLREAVDQALREVAPFLEDKRINLAAEIEPAPQQMYFDAARVEQMLINLLDNACKFTPRGGAIEIKGYPFFWDRRMHQAVKTGTPDRRLEQVRHPNCLRIDILDSGPGIAPAHLNKIFEEYTSYSGGNDRSGGGLGLAICKMIALQHGGQIWAENTASGARFSFVVPFRRAEERKGAGADSSTRSAYARAV
jgi:signal transduction histidine kinase